MRRTFDHELFGGSLELTEGVFQNYPEVVVRSKLIF